MIVASETARFGQPEITLGIIPGGGGTQRLARVLGKQRAMEYVLTGRRFDAEMAHEMGLVNKVVEERPLAGARRWSWPAPSPSGRRSRRGSPSRRCSPPRRPRSAPGLEDERAPLRAGDGDRGPGRGHAGLPREARAASSRGDERRLTRRADRRRRRRHDGRRASPSSPRWAATRPCSTTRSRRRSRPAVERIARRRWPRAPSGPLERARKPKPRAAASAPRRALADLGGCDLVIEAAPEDLELKRGLFAALAERLRRPRRSSPPTPPRCR